METPTRWQFQQLRPEAQRAALWRLAWNGLSVEQMAQRTGWSVDQVRSKMAEETLLAYPVWQRPDLAERLTARKVRSG
jgi:hypothetical protein